MSRWGTCAGLSLVPLATSPMMWATRGQLASLAMGLRRRLGLRARGSRLDWCQARAGRPLDTSAELLRAEASRLLAQIRPGPTSQGPGLPSTIHSEG